MEDTSSKKKPLEMCMDVPFDLESTKSITQPKGLNEEELLQSIHQINLMKDDKRSAEVAKEGDVHVKPTGVDMLTQRDVSLKELNLLKRKNVLMRASGKSIVSINEPTTNEEDEMGLTPNKEELTSLRRSLVAKRSVLPQKITIEQMEKGSGELKKFVTNSIYFKLP
jgi:hypothetical protein